MGGRSRLELKVRENLKICLFRRVKVSMVSLNADFGAEIVAKLAMFMI
jgi:hypothetical protein